MGKGDAPPPSAANAVQVEIAGITDVGQVRDHNEDAFLIASLGDKAVDRSEDGYRGPLPAAGLLFAVADGMGGAASGEVASRMAVDTLTDQLRDGYPPDADKDLLQRGLEGALTTANEKIYAVASQDAKHRGMGTTMTVVLASGDRICFSQIGDSRAYLFRKGELVQITKDQSLIEQLIEDGTLTAEEAERIGGKNIILQALGVEDAIRADTRHLELLDEDLLLVCSDGLSGMIPDSDIQEVLAAVEDPAEACRTLVEKANAAGGRDNISVIVARFRGGGLRAPAGATGDLVVQGKPPPESTAGPGRGKLYGLIAAVVAVGVFLTFLFTGGSNPLVLEFNVKGVSGTLVPLDAEGEPDAGRRMEFEAEGDRHQFDDLDTGTWQLEVSRDGYRPKTVEVRVAAGGSSVKVDLEVLDRRVRVKTTVPGAMVLLQRRDGEPEEQEFVEVEEVVFYRKPGTYELIVRARGYETHRDEIVVPKVGEPEPIEIALREHKGTLVLTGVAPGSRFEATDQDDRVVEGEVPESGELVLREGTYDLEITGARYKPWPRKSVQVIGGERTEPLAVKQELRRVNLLIRVGPETRAGNDTISIFRGDGEPEDLKPIPEPEADGFAVRSWSLEQGEYEIRVGEASQKVVLRAGENPPPVVFP